MPTLYEVFAAAAAAHPERPAIEVEGEQTSYVDLERLSRRVAATLRSKRSHDGPPLTCVLAQRSVAAFSGILGSLSAGHGYVPILPTFPESRVQTMLERSRARELVVDAGGEAHLEAILTANEDRLTVVLLDSEVPEGLAERFPGHTLVGKSELASEAQWAEPEVAGSDIAYILFTSGSTGLPKGVMVSHDNISRFLDVVVERYSLVETDRFSHMFELTFDLSLFDMFGAWKVGGCLCCPGPRERLLPARFVNDAKISVWFSVPSTALLMKKTRTLTEGAFPGLRWSLFCGEALPVEVANAWRAASPNSKVENIYGPTELTLACTGYMCDERLDDASDGEVVPIGEPFPGMRVLVADPEQRAVGPGEDGELLMAGPQLTLGYWDDAERTAKAFVTPPGEQEVFYRTGDRVRRPGPGEPLIFLGRVDHQIKVRGYRVELGEIESVMRREASVDAAIAVGWPLTSESGAGADGIVGFIEDDSVDLAGLRERMAAHLPGYMLPKRIIVVEEFPLNANGKIDRNALRATLQ
jgi:amino acid adenylation domain-containing protein